MIARLVVMDYVNAGSIDFAGKDKAKPDDTHVGTEKDVGNFLTKLQARPCVSNTVATAPRAFEGSA